MKREQDIFERLQAFVKYQRRFWRQLEKGVIPEPQTVQSWLETCDFAADDIKELEKLIKGTQ